MTPGRELDALVAEKVMGKTIVRCVDEYLNVMHELGGDFFGKKYVCTTEAHNNSFKMHRPGQTIAICPSYSTDIAGAWQVVDELIKRQFSFIVANDRIATGIGTTGVNKHWASFGVSGLPIEVSVGESFPHAICLAALKVMGVTLEG